MTEQGFRGKVGVHFGEQGIKGILDQGNTVCRRQGIQYSPNNVSEGPAISSVLLECKTQGTLVGGEVRKCCRD